MEKKPYEFEMVPPCNSLNLTEAPTSSSPVDLSFTVPLIVNLFWAKDWTDRRKAIVTNSLSSLSLRDNIGCI